MPSVGYHRYYSRVKKNCFDFLSTSVIKCKYSAVMSVVGTSTGVLPIFSSNCVSDSAIPISVFIIS